MIFALDIFYYLVLLSLYISIPILYRSKVPLLSLSGIFLILNFVFIVIPGYFNYRGGVIYEETSTIDTRAYILFFCQAFIAPFAVYAGWLNSRVAWLTVEARRNVKSSYVILLVFVILYNIFYIIFNANQLPIFQIISGNLIEAAVNRSQLTHGFADSELPWYFSYYRIFTKDLIFLLIIPVFIFGKFWTSIPRLASVLTLIFLLLMHVEKAYMLYLILGIFLAQTKFKSPSVKSIITITLMLGFSSILSIYALFSESIADAINYLPIRLSAQTGYVVSQLKVFDTFGFLGVEGVRLGFFNKLLHVEYIDISKLAFNEVHYNFAALGIVGSSAGSSMAELYMIMGYLSPVVFFFFISMSALLDKYLYSIVVVNLNDDRKFIVQLARSFYIYFVCFYALAPVGSVFGIFSVVTLFQPALLLAAIIFFALFRLKFKRMRFVAVLPN